jgi:hypothetical protein
MISITQDDLLQYLYSEGSADKMNYISIHSLTDLDLQERLSILKGGKSRLDKFNLISPDERTMENIFNYSKHGVIQGVHVHI